MRRLRASEEMLTACLAVSLIAAALALVVVLPIGVADGWRWTWPVVLPLVGNGLAWLVAWLFRSGHLRWEFPEELDLGPCPDANKRGDYR